MAHINGKGITNESRIEYEEKKTQWMVAVSEDGENATQRFGEWQERETKHLPRLDIDLSEGSKMSLGQGEEPPEVYVDASGNSGTSLCYASEGTSNKLVNKCCA